MPTMSSISPMRPRGASLAIPAINSSLFPFQEHFGGDRTR